MFNKPTSIVSPIMLLFITNLKSIYTFDFKTAFFTSYKLIWNSEKTSEFGEFLDVKAIRLQKRKAI
jgi:hypothetical protein